MTTQPVYRFDVTFLTAGAYRVSWGERSATSESALARLMVEAGVPDGAIEGGRAGRHDWTFRSLHRVALRAVTAAERAAGDGALHPALSRALQAVVAERKRVGP